MGVQQHFKDDVLIVKGRLSPKEVNLTVAYKLQEAVRQELGELSGVPDVGAVYLCFDEEDAAFIYEAFLC